jgi:MHS family proline/betaine transporter-like MFS transporter
MGDWGWRVPFVFGMLVGPVAYVIRFHADESPEFAQAAEQRHDRADLVLDRGFWGRVMVGAALVVVGSAMLYLLIYMPTLVTAQFGVSRSASLWTSVCAGLTLLCATPVAGAIGDRYGRQWLALPSCALLVPAPILLFHLLDANPTATQALLTQFLLALPVAAYLGALAAMLSDLFSLRHRSLGLAICYNAAVVAAGAFAPLIYAELGARVGRVAPSYYASAAAVISLLALGIVLSRRWLPRD